MSDNKKKFDITVIIPTTAKAIRKTTLLLAIDSLVNQIDVTPNILIVINGKCFDPDLRNDLENTNNINIIYQEIGSAPLACALGRKNVTTEYFCFLDDDDYLLPDALKTRIDIFNRDRSLDVVVSNGLRKLTNKTETLIFPKGMNQARIDPLKCLFIKKSNWMASCAATFKSSSITQSFFEDYTNFYEWTYLAIRISLKKKIAFIDAPGYVINFTPNSLSTTTGFLIGQIEFHNAVSSLDLPKDIKNRSIIRWIDSWHSLSEYYRKDGLFKLAWQAHLNSLSTIKGFIKYFAYSRKLLINKQTSKKNNFQ